MALAASLASALNDAHATMEQSLLHEDLAYAAGEGAEARRPAKPRPSLVFRAAARRPEAPPPPPPPPPAGGC